MENNNDKKKYSILNNTYKTGEKLQGDNFEFYSSVKIDEVATSIFMKDCCDFNSIFYDKMVEKTYELINNNETLVDLIKQYDDKKFSKEDINVVFSIIYDFFSKDEEFKYFFNIFFIFSIVSDITNTAYDVIFNSLTYENKIPVIDALSEESDLTF